MPRQPELGEHNIKHTCGHSVRYIAVPPRLYIQLFGEALAYQLAISEHTEATAGKPCEDCQHCNDGPHIDGLQDEIWH